jgi:hypothetical protein
MAVLTAQHGALLFTLVGCVTAVAFITLGRYLLER